LFLESYGRILPIDKQTKLICKGCTTLKKCFNKNKTLPNKMVGICGKDAEDLRRDCRATFKLIRIKQ
jgi:hypothetical protein